MKLIPLLLANLVRKRIRTSLTFVSLSLAFLLYTLLQAVSNAFAGGVTLAGMERIVIDSKYSLTDNLPLAYVQQIRSLDEVDQVTNVSWFGGYYKTPQNSFATYPVDPESYFDVFEEQKISHDALDRFKNTRISAVASRSLAAQYGWKIGDTISITQDIFPQENGSWNWEFQFAGTFHYPEGQLLLINYDYFNEAVVAWGKDQVGWLVGKVSQPGNIDSTVQTIDEMFENSSDPTRSVTEDEFRRQFASQLGNVGTISSMIMLAVFFTIILLTGNTAARTFAEKIPELAVMKTLGFGEWTLSALVVAEAIVLCVSGGIAGIACALLLEPSLNASFSGMVGRFEIDWQITLNALVLASLLGLMISAYPAFSAYRLAITEALMDH